MTVDDLITSIRYDLNDVDAVEYTNAELIEYINRAQEWINQELINLGSQYVLKKTGLELVENSAPLPEDFIKEYAVVSGGISFESILPTEELKDYAYKIYNGKLYAKASSVDFYYFYAFPRYIAPADTIMLPSVLTNMLKSLVVLMAKNRIEVPANLELSMLQDFRRKLEDFAGLGLANIPVSAPFSLKR